MTDVPPKLAYTIKQACYVSGLGRTSLYEAMATGRLPWTKPAGRRLIWAEDLKAFMSESN